MKSLAPALYADKGKMYVVEDELVLGPLSHMTLEQLGEIDLDALICVAAREQGVPVWRCERVRSMPDWMKR